MSRSVRRNETAGKGNGSLREKQTRREEKKREEKKRGEVEVCCFFFGK